MGGRSWGRASLVGCRCAFFVFTARSLSDDLLFASASALSHAWCALCAVRCARAVMSSVMSTVSPSPYI